jgi:hypothetical protein
MANVAAPEQAEDLLNELRFYATHQPGCPVGAWMSKSPDALCTCGFTLLADRLALLGPARWEPQSRSQERRLAVQSAARPELRVDREALRQAVSDVYPEPWGNPEYADRILAALEGSAPKENQ